MSRKVINIGDEPNDGMGDPLRNILSNINDMTLDLYQGKYLVPDVNSIIINDEDDQYAHTSNVLINRCDDKALMFVMYEASKIESTEPITQGIWCWLRVYELTTKTLLNTFLVFHDADVAGLTLPSLLWDGRMQVVGTTLYCYISAGAEMYYRTIDISTSDAANWVMSDYAKMQAYMKNANDEDELVNINSTTIQTHLESIFGTTDTDFENLTPLLRNFDKPHVYNGVMYSMFEFNGELVGKYSIQSIITSTDNGLTWNFGSVVGFTIANKYSMYEASCVFLDDVLHVIARAANGGYVYHFSSSDLGATWSARNNLAISTMAGKPTAINIYENDKTEAVILAVQLKSLWPNSTGRTTLGIFKTTDFAVFTEVAIICSPSYAHYPSMCSYSRGLYVSYSKGMRFNTDGQNDGAYDRNTIVVTRIY